MQVILTYMAVPGHWESRLIISDSPANLYIRLRSDVAVGGPVIVASFQILRRRKQK